MMILTNLGNAPPVTFPDEMYEQENANSDAPDWS